jgi:protein-tyrosine phosphatase
MIDTHLHILPGVDDGPATLQESLLLARLLVQEGIHIAVATPHYNDQFPQRHAMEIRERVYNLQQELDRQNIRLEVLAGHEVLIKPGLVEDIQAERLTTLNSSRYLLLELWESAWIPETERVIFELRASGIVPVIAHPERYHFFQQDPARLGALIQQGVLTQLMAGSLIGNQGNTIRKTAETLLRRGLIHCIASDAHGPHKRRPHIISALTNAERLLGSKRVFSMIETCPTAIIHDEEWLV